MINIEVGEYVRTKNGYIIKYKDNINTNIFSCDDVLYVENSLFPDEEEIVNHSKNIIDLIEVGDIVKVFSDLHDIMGNQTFMVENKTHLNHLITGFNGGYFHLKSIVTKEQFKAIEYEVE